MIIKKGGTVFINLETKEIGLVYRDYLVDYSFPKGHLEKGESLLECALRETEEETGHKCHAYSNKEIGIVKYETNKKKLWVNIYMYIAIDDGITDKYIKEEDRETLVWKDIDSVEENLSYSNLKKFWNDVKPIIQNIFDNQYMWKGKYLNGKNKKSN